MNLEPLLLFVVLYSPGPSWDPDKPLMEQDLRPHGAFIKSLRDEGVIIAAGPLIERKGGLVLIRAESQRAAAEIAAGDPAVKSGVFIADVQTWHIAFASDGFTAEAKSP